jgi:hypothetical protein
MVALSTGDVTSGLGRPSGGSRRCAIIIRQKAEYNFEMMHVRQEMCIEH